MIRIVNQDCIEFMQSEPHELVACNYSVAFADPPDNINLGYEGHEDRLDAKEYRKLCCNFVYESMRLVSKGLWVSFNARHALMMASVIEEESDVDWVVTPCVQTITFGNQRNKPGRLTNNYRPLWYISWGEPNFNEVREPSWRQQNGDKRANPKGKLVSDVFDFPRVTGNSKQRRAWHPTQLNEKLVERCLLLTTQEGDHVLDIFAGTGTTGRVCRSIGRKCTLVEKSPFYCDKMREELLDGQADSSSEASAHQDAGCVNGCNDSSCNGQAQAAV